LAQNPELARSLPTLNPLVFECNDGWLNDARALALQESHVAQALAAAREGPESVAQGSVGAGRGMSCHGLKGGIGSASRKLPTEAGGYTVGVLVQCNYGLRQHLRVAGVPVGQEIPDLLPGRASGGPGDTELGSIIVVVATDAPLLPHQLKRVVTRVSVGLAKMGGYGGNSSGDIFVAFSTANPRAYGDTGVARVEMIPNARINPLFYATAQATEEAIINALLAAETMTGIDDTRVYALPVDRLRAAMAKYGRPLSK